MARTDLTVRPQLDGLRAVAMIGVLYVHFWDSSPVTEHVRVTLFLVLSGFLITYMLTTAKARGGILVVRNFYIRRALRLFPPLLITFVLAYILDADGFRSSAGWHILPTSNIYFSINETTRPWVVGHLWSLNLLEQFYLTWPLAILFLSEKTLHIVIILGIFALTFVRANASALGVDGWWLFFVFSFDPILMGAFFYLIQRHRQIHEVLTGRFATALSLAILVSPILISHLDAWHEFGHSDSYRFLSQTAIAVLVVGAFAGYSGPIGWSLKSSLARFLAKISYGVYVYHLLIWYVIVQIYPSLFAKGPMTFIVLTALTIVIAMLSWRFIEAPISRMKRYFPVRQE
jgi:peptidoglycan/LPS O-acetylase OafA/YrhL